MTKLQHGPNTKRYLQELYSIFQTTTDKREAHQKSKPLLEDIVANRDFIREVLSANLSMPGIFSRKHYPVLAMMIESNPYFDLLINCWLPLADRRIDLSTKTIHHHGTMLLTTTTLFGTGYEHWTFARPVLKSGDIYKLQLLGRTPHPQGHVAFVDSYIAHLPLYPPDLTLTLALWSNSRPTTWKDHLKRFGPLRKNANLLRKLALRAGLKKTLELKVVEYFDFYPTREGFCGMKERKEFPLGPNKNYLSCLFAVLQQTNNESLAQKLLIEEVPQESKETFRSLLSSLQSNTPITGELSEGHSNLLHANFTIQNIEAALLAQEK